MAYGEPGESYNRVVVALTQTFHDRLQKQGVQGVLAWLSELPLETRHLFCTYSCWAIICWNRFWMFYHFTEGMLAPEAVGGFQALGLPGCAAALAEANA